MSIIKNSGLKQVSVATNRGWEDTKGKLIISSRNLLNNRVSQGLASPEEILRWGEEQLIELEHRKNKFSENLEINEARLWEIKNAFEAENAHLANSEDTLKQVEYHQKKIDHLKVVAIYEKNFRQTNLEIQKLNSLEEKIQLKMNSVLGLIPKKGETVFENQFVNPPATIETNKQENTNIQPIQAAKVKVPVEKKEKKRPGPKKGWKARRLIEQAKALPELNPPLDYPIPPAEIIQENNGSGDE